jgi:hypothetical protein
VLTGGAIGGYAGARFGRVVPARMTRILVLGLTGGMTCLFFARAYLAGL